MWCAGASPTPPRWPPSILMTAPPPLHLAVPSLSLQALSSPEDEGLPQCVHLLAQQTWNYSSSRIHTCSQFGLHTGNAIVERLRNLRKGLSPDPPPLSDSCPTIHFACFVSDQLQELRTRDSSRKRVVSDPVSFVDNSR